MEKWDKGTGEIKSPFLRPGFKSGVQIRVYFLRAVCCDLFGARSMSGADAGEALGSGLDHGAESVVSQGALLLQVAADRHEIIV